MCGVNNINEVLIPTEAFYIRRMESALGRKGDPSAAGVLHSSHKNVMQIPPKILDIHVTDE